MRRIRRTRGGPKQRCTGANFRRLQKMIITTSHMKKKMKDMKVINHHKMLHAQAGNIFLGHASGCANWSQVNRGRQCLLQLCFRKTLCLFFTLILLAHGVYPIPSDSTTDHVHHSIVQDDTNAGRSDGCDGGVDRSVEVISWEPRVVINHNFLSKKECEYLINVAKPHMKRSTIFDLGTRETYEDTWFRPCSLTFLDRGQDETIRAIEKRIADFTFLPVENGEGLQVVHYDVGDKYPLHYDFYDDYDYQIKNGGQVMATFLMYLSDAEDGGETAFPYAMGKYNDVYRAFEYSECNTSILFAKPKMGDALLLWNVKPDGTPEYSSKYAECPVIKGNKWTARKWIRAKEYHKK